MMLKPRYRYCSGVSRDISKEGGVNNLDPTGAAFLSDILGACNIHKIFRSEFGFLPCGNRSFLYLQTPSASSEFLFDIPRGGSVPKSPALEARAKPFAPSAGLPFLPQTAHNRPHFSILVSKPRQVLDLKYTKISLVTKIPPLSIAVIITNFTPFHSSTQKIRKDGPQTRSLLPLLQE